MSYPVQSFHITMIDILGWEDGGGVREGEKQTKQNKKKREENGEAYNNLLLICSSENKKM